MDTELLDRPGLSVSPPAHPAVEAPVPPRTTDEVGPEPKPSSVTEPAPEPAAATAGMGRRFARDVLRGLGMVVFLHLFVLQISVVRGHSMRPGLVDGDRLVVDRLSYSFQDVQRFDVVVLRNPKDPSVDYVKRVVGLPGDRVSLCEGELYVNGEPIDEGFGPISDRANTDEVLVPAGAFYVLGDNRPISCDSREFGLVDGELLKGKVRVRFWPLSRFALFD